MKKLRIIFLVMVGCMMLEAQAQDYQNALGLRISPYYGVTFKHFFNGERAFEGIFMSRRGGFGVTGLYEIHTPLFSVPRLQAYGGIGAHINIYRDKYRRTWDWDDSRDTDLRISQDHYLAAGIDMILGIEYTIEKLPFNFALDWKPALNLIGDYGLSADQLALSVRFVF
jgi:hypothetical protein